MYPSRCSKHHVEKATEGRNHRLLRLTLLVLSHISAAVRRENPCDDGRDHHAERKQIAHHQRQAHVQPTLRQVHAHKQPAIATHQRNAEDARVDCGGGLKKHRQYGDRELLPVVHDPENALRRQNGGLIADVIVDAMQQARMVGLHLLLTGMYLHYKLSLAVCWIPCCAMRDDAHHHLIVR